MPIDLSGRIGYLDLRHRNGKTRMLSLFPGCAVESSRDGLAAVSRVCGVVKCI
jgi:hypothetical protein